MMHTSGLLRVTDVHNHFSIKVAKTTLQDRAMPHNILYSSRPPRKGGCCRVVCFMKFLEKPVCRFVREIRKSKNANLARKECSNQKG